MTNSQQTPQTRAKRPAGDHKAHTNRRAQRHSKHKTEQKHKRFIKEVPPWNGQLNILLEGHSDPKIVRESPPSQDASTHRIWDSYLKKRREYASGTIILESRLEVKVTMTDGRTDERTPCWSQYHPTDKVRGKTVGDMLRTNKVTVTPKWYATHPHPNMHPHTKFGIPTSNNVGDMHRT